MKNSNVVVSSDYGPIIINLKDIYIGKSIITSGYWGLNDHSVIKNLLDFQLKRFTTVTFYDVGANIGTHALAVAKTYGGKVKTRAFEAQRQVFNMLCGTMAINGIESVYCYNNAVSDRDGESMVLTLPDYHQPNNFGGFELVPAKHNSESTVLVRKDSETVSSLSLDSFDEQVDLIKMDIEGMEDKALMGAVSLIETYRPILFVEILKTDVAFITNFFRSRNYSGYGTKRSKDWIIVPVELNVPIGDLEKKF